MEKEEIILVAEQNEEYFSMIHQNLLRAGIRNKIVRFVAADQLLDFLMVRGDGPKRQSEKKYLLILDVNLPSTNGKKVLEQIKQDSKLRKIPVVMLDDENGPKQAELYHDLGCSIYMTKPAEPTDFREAVERLGLFLLTVKIPTVNGVL